MSDYAQDIDSSGYLYMQEISLSEKSSLDQVDLVVKLTFDPSNFNFDFARSDGKDFRLAEKSNGSYILNMWIANWDVTNKKATVYFKLPYLLANSTKKLYAYWGCSSDSGISDCDSIGALVADGFDGGTLDTTKWVSNGGYTISDSKINLSSNSYYLEAKNTPIAGIYSWVFENGFYITDSSVHTTSYSVCYRFYGGDNVLGINFYGEGSKDRYHDFVVDGVYADDDGSYRGLKGDSYHNSLVGYHEPIDYIYQGFSQRKSYSDYFDTTERQCHGNTRITYFRIYGKESNGSHVYHDWVIVRKFLGSYEPEFDLSNLYVQYEQVNPDTIEWGFGDDVTDVNFEHTTSSGGDPDKLSDNSLFNIWCSDNTGAEGGGVDLVVYFNTWGDNLVDIEYLHYDNGHITFFNASKLSDNDEDVNNNTYWQSTTTSGWACIDFGASSVNNIGIFTTKAVVDDLDCAPKNYKFEGSYTYHNDWEHYDWKLLDEGQFEKTVDWQSRCFVNEVKYRFYRLRVIGVWSGSCIKLQEWKMYNYNESVGKKIVGKLKLKPVNFDSQYIYFPKQIKFYGSDDLVNWDTLIDTKNTYTPLDCKWQEHVFPNEKKYYYYKLTCIGNWNDGVGKICIAEWEMLERSSEVYIYRILSGVNNNFNSIWAQEDCRFDGGEFYVVNEGLNIVDNDKLIDYIIIFGIIMDLNVV